MFDDALLDDPIALATRGDPLAWLAMAGARLRREPWDEIAAAVPDFDGVRPRSLLVIGAEARLIRAVVEATCAVPCIAWPRPTLPPWAGPLDLVMVLADAETSLLEVCREVVKRGALLIVVAPSGSPILDGCGAATALVTSQDDRFVTALLALKILDLAGLAPELDLDQIADHLDKVAERCGPRHGLEVNPAKNLACALADAVPLVWGGSVLAARASRRIAEALREATGAPAVAGDEEALRPLIEGCRPRNVFGDPYEDESARIRFALLVLDDGEDPGLGLAELAASRNQRQETIRCASGSPVVRYAELVHQGLFAAAYLGLATMAE
ncbi:MAG: hypothetical protein LBE83_10035 [Propionibacteriaceae bacterium]|jgi:hypothetical protein|nr:hypothetical protein [Propionibacteriaceae bacterium]